MLEVEPGSRPPTSADLPGTRHRRDQQLQTDCAEQQQLELLGIGGEGSEILLYVNSSVPKRWTLQGPGEDLPVHPAQLYAALDALLLFLFLLAYEPFQQRDGELVALMLTIHQVALSGSAPRPARGAEPTHRRRPRRLQRAARAATEEWVAAFTEETASRSCCATAPTASSANQLVQEGDESPADVFLTENSPAMSLVEKAGLLAPVDQATLEQVPGSTARRAALDRHRRAVDGVRLQPRACSTEAELPASIMDLADPTWQGRWGAPPARRRLPGDRRRLLAARGRGADAAWLDGHEGRTRRSTRTTSRR